MIFFVILLSCRCISQCAVKMSKHVQTHYDVLGLTPSATQAQIRDAFVQLSKQVFHYVDCAAQQFCSHCTA